MSSSEDDGSIVLVSKCSKESFNVLVEKTGTGYEKQDTHFRRFVCVRERLTINTKTYDKIHVVDEAIVTATFYRSLAIDRFHVTSHRVNGKSRRYVNTCF